MGLLNRWPAKRAQKVKGTHTVSLKKEKSIFVSSALNAYQASNIYFLENKKGGHRQDRLLPLGGIHPADALLRTLTVTGTVHRVQPATFKGFI